MNQTRDLIDEEDTGSLSGVHRLNYMLYCEQDFFNN